LKNTIQQPVKICSELRWFYDHSQTLPPETRTSNRIIIRTYLGRRQLLYGSRTAITDDRYCDRDSGSPFSPMSFLGEPRGDIVKCWVREVGASFSRIQLARRFKACSRDTSVLLAGLAAPAIEDDYLAAPSWRQFLCRFGTSLLAHCSYVDVEDPWLRSSKSNFVHPQLGAVKTLFAQGLR
jgi:hypothetical protein